MRIVMTTDTYWPRINGVTVAVEGFRRALTKLGHEVIVLAPLYPRPEGDASPPDDERIIRFPAFSLPFSPEDRLGYPAARWRITRLLEDLKPDVVHAHSEFTIGFGGKSYCRRSGVPHVMTCHTYWEHYIQAYFPFLLPAAAKLIARTWSRSDYRLVDCLTVPSQFLKRHLLTYGVETPIEVIPNGVDPEEFTMSPAERAEQAAYFRRVMPQLAGRRLLLYVGRIAHEKNIDFLLECLGRVIRTVPKALLLMAGDGPYRAGLERKAAAQGLGGNVLFPGYLDRKKLAYIYGASDLFVFSSKTETQGLVLVEAMTCGTPVVALRATATEEVLTDGEGGSLVEEDIAAFTDRVLYYLRDEHARKAAGERARAVSRRWTLEKTTEMLLAVYERAIDERLSELKKIS
jgi:1,2-diacylglycerol 3-alpha-glucosyltransferase